MSDILTNLQLTSQISPAGTTSCFLRNRLLLIVQREELFLNLTRIFAKFLCDQHLEHGPILIVICLAVLLGIAIYDQLVDTGNAVLAHHMTVQTLALWIMFVMTVPQFADVLAPISTTHNPTAFFVVSLLALASNVALAAYQFHRIRKLKLNPLKDQIYADTKAYQRIVEENK